MDLKKYSVNNIIDQIRVVADPKDFEKNKDIVMNLELHKYSIFYNCLISGASIEGAKHATDCIFKMAKDTHLTPINIFEFAKQFRKINYLIDNG